MAKSRTQYPQKTKRSSAKSGSQYAFSEPTIVKVEPQVKKKFTQKDMIKVEPLTENQSIAFQHWENGQHLVLEGYAGVGKSFLSMAMALNVVLDPSTPQTKIIIVKSSVQARSIGFLPGSLEDKDAVYETPYMQICDQLFPWKNSYLNMKELGIIEFHNTSFLRGMTFDNAVVIFDEFQNTDSGEGETVISRMGLDSRIIICGDDLQNDIGSKSNGKGFLTILRKMESISCISFDLEDVVRSGLVREYLMAKYSK